MNLGTVDFNLLKVLDALIAERNVTRAGKRLGRSQPAVSNALQRLRNLLGDDLLVRGPNGFVLTPRAESIRDAVCEAVARVEGCLAGEPRFDPASAAGVFRLSAPDRLNLVIVPLLHARLQKLAPNMALQILTADRRQAIELLDNDRIDLALGWLDEKPRHLNAEFIMDEDLFCVFRKDHPINKRNTKFDIKAVLSFPHLVVSATGQRAAIFDDLLLMRHGLRRDPLISVTNFSAVPQLLLCSDMIGVFTELAADAFQKTFKLVKRPLPIDVGKISTNLLWQSSKDKDPRHIWQRNQVKAIYESLR